MKTYFKSIKTILSAIIFMMVTNSANATLLLQPSTITAPINLWLLGIAGGNTVRSCLSDFFVEGKMCASLREGRENFNGRDTFRIAFLFGGFLLLDGDDNSSVQLTKISQEQAELVGLSTTELEAYNTNMNELKLLIDKIPEYIIQNKITDINEEYFNQLITQKGVNIEPNAISAYKKIRDYNASLQKN